MDKFTEIKNERFRSEICKLMSEMLDNPDKYGIYPTAKFMSRMEDFVLKIRHETLGWAWAKACGLLDAEIDPRQYDQANLIPDASVDLDNK